MSRRRSGPGRSVAAAASTGPASPSVQVPAEDTAPLRQEGIDALRSDTSAAAASPALEYSREAASMIDPPDRSPPDASSEGRAADAGPPSTVPGFLQPYVYPASGRADERPPATAPGPLRPMRASSSPDFDIDADARSDLQDKLIGEILRVTNKLDAGQIDQILADQAQRKKKFGESAIALGLVEHEDVMWALSQQFQYAYTPGSQGALSDELILASQPFGEAAEIFREMRTQLLMNVLDGSPRRALSVISAGVGEGKTFFAANLAIAFSQLGARTLLIDADMRTPRLHKLFGVETVNGLSATLSGRAQASVVRPIESLPSLYLLPVGAAPPNPSELVQRPGFAMMIKGALRNFEHVIVDTPAAQHGPDARVIASRCGAALAIGRKHRTPLGKLQTLIEQVSKHTDRFAGVVMNDF